MDNTRVSACTTIHFQPSDNFIVLAAVSGENLIESRGLSDFGALLPLPDFRIPNVNADRASDRWTMEGAPTPVPRDAHACGGSCASSQGMTPGAACAAGARPPASPQTPDLAGMRRNHFPVPTGRALSMSAAPPAPITRADLTRAFETQLGSVLFCTDLEMFLAPSMFCRFRHRKSTCFRQPPLFVHIFWQHVAFRPCNTVLS